MRMIRLATICALLLGAATTTARAQRWGGGGVGASARPTPRAPNIRVSQRRLAYGGPILLIPAPAIDCDSTRPRTAPGGAWTGTASQWGGSPPSPPARRERFVAPSPVIVPAVAAAAVAAPAPVYLSVREQYLRRMRGNP